MSQQEQDKRIDYIEIPATDVQASKAFYQQVFGWTFTDYGPDYSSFEDGRIAGGLRKEETNSTGGVLVVMYAVDLESVLNSVTEAGGKITREIFSFPGGKRFHFLDPGNNELAVWSEQ